MHMQRCSYGEQCRFSHVSPCARMIRRLYQTRHTLDICVFSLTCDDMAQAIIRAMKRDVSVRLITDTQQAASEDSKITSIKSGGVACITVGSPGSMRPNGTRQPGKLMHHKFAIFDKDSESRALLNGSANWTRSGTTKNEENVVITRNQRLVAAFSKQFETLWSNHSFRSA